VRAASLVFGLFLFAVGIVALLESKLGLSPWDVLNQGLAKHSPLTFGLANIVVGLAVLVLAWALGAPPGVGTVANAVLIGLFIDGLTRVGSVDALADGSLAARAGLLPLGIALMGIGSAFYIGANYGAGPRDSLMLVVSHRSRRRIGLVRAGLEACALAIGFVLGGTVGIGTLAFALLIGPAVEASFWLLGRSPLATPRGLCGSEPLSPELSRIQGDAAENRVERT
jgi:uncharacterized membrane protein YczE